MRTDNTPGMDPTAAAESGPDSVDRAIRRDIATAIFDQRMPPGTRLSEARLGELYDVSRTVVRKALYQLASDKLVDIRPNRGAMVAQPTIQEAREVFEARRLVESALLEHSVPAMAAADHQRLRQLVAADQAAHDNRDPQQMIRASGDFHRGLAALADNTVLHRFLDQLIGRTSLIIAMYQAQASAACSHDAHEQLMAVIERGDVAGARQTMQRHLQDIEQQLDLSDSSTGGGLAQMLGVAATRD